MRNRSFRHNTSGQVIIVSALLVALLLLSTAMYVIETQKQTPTVDTESEVFFGYQQAARNALISALANVTGGGSNAVLASDLSELETVILAHSYNAMATLDFAVLNSGSYQNGIWTSWGTDGNGISSAYATFWLNASSPQASSTMEYALNVTSTITSTGVAQQIDANTTQITLTIHVFNEDKPALAQSFAVSYQNQTGWVAVDAPSVTDYGNGTYTVLFTAPTVQLVSPAVASLECYDARGIIVGANITCTGS